MFFSSWTDRVIGLAKVCYISSGFAPTEKAQNDGA